MSSLTLPGSALCSALVEGASYKLGRIAFARLSAARARKRWHCAICDAVETALESAGVSTLRGHRCPRESDVRERCTAERETSRTDGARKVGVSNALRGHRRVPERGLRKRHVCDARSHGALFGARLLANGCKRSRGLQKKV